ncbi:MAG: lipid-A-disaccharide synthase [Legionella sp.]|nr:MAG: lipid-A-disaccharide synthase [Legionella sp.]
MHKAKHVVIIAGEESGDAHAADLIKQLKAVYPDIRISGIGGKHMEKAGAEMISDLAKYGVTGASEVLRLFKTIKDAFKRIKEHLLQQRPDLLILVDYPGFNLRLAKYAKEKLGLKILYYISPQIWAWKPKRIHLIKKTVDRMAVILPFEKYIYEKAGVPVSFVGHPLIEKIPANPDIQTYRNNLNLDPQAKIIALLPGSRNNEIQKHMPVLRDTAILQNQLNPELQFVIPIAGTINPEQIKAYFKDLNLPITFIQGKALDCMIAADFVIVASGTASLECALLEKPMCIIYKSSLLTYYLAMKFINIRYLGLCNLLLDKLWIPEFLQYDCNAEELSRYLTDFYNDPEQPAKMKSGLKNLKDLLSTKDIDCSLFGLVEKELSEISA